MAIIPTVITGMVPVSSATDTGYGTQELLSGLIVAPTPPNTNPNPTSTLKGSVINTFDVRSYGAKWNGVTDDSVAINATIAAAAAGGVAIGQFYRNGSVVQIRIS